MFFFMDCSQQSYFYLCKGVVEKTDFKHTIGSLKRRQKIRMGHSKVIKRRDTVNTKKN